MIHSKQKLETRLSILSGQLLPAAPTRGQPRREEAAHALRFHPCFVWFVDGLPQYF